MNGKTPMERHNNAYFAWEALLKLLASVVITRFASKSIATPVPEEILRPLLRPSTGHWWSFVRELCHRIEPSDDPEIAKLGRVLFGETLHDVPRVAGLATSLRQSSGGRNAARVSVHLDEVFANLIRYRNTEFGHGAPGQKDAHVYDQMARILLLAMVEATEKTGVFSRSRLELIVDVRQSSSGGWRVERFELSGETPRRLEPIKVPDADRSDLPRSHCVYFASREDAADIRPTRLFPLVSYDDSSDEFYFLNGQRGRNRAEYLCYTTGKVVSVDSSVDDLYSLLARLTGKKADESVVQDWAGGDKVDETHQDSIAGSDAKRWIGDYALESKLGFGTMGVVYRAWQPSLSRHVALKCLLQSGEPKSEARFDREIRALGRVEHPNLVKIYSSGADGDQWYYAMELVDGADLGSILDHLTEADPSDLDETRWSHAITAACEVSKSRERPVSSPSSEDGLDNAPENSDERIPPVDNRVRALDSDIRASRPEHVRHVVSLIRQVASAAHALHEAGVLHRDIKPANIMITPDGDHAILMDLGLAKIVDDDGRLSRTRQFIGTPRYASPEQIIAPATIDRRSDVYSIGATLWELLTLKPLFSASDASPEHELFARIPYEEPERPRRINKAVDGDLESIVLKCLSKDRTERYGMASEIESDLARWERGEPVTAQPPTLPYLLRKFARRHRWPIIGALLALVVLTIGVIGAFVRIDSEREAAEQAKYQALQSQERAEREERKAKKESDRARKAESDAKVALSRLSDATQRIDEIHGVLADIIGSSRTDVRRLHTRRRDHPLPSYVLGYLLDELKGLPERERAVWEDSLDQLDERQSSFLFIFLVKRLQSMGGYTASDLHESLVHEKPALSELLSVSGASLPAFQLMMAEYYVDEDESMARGILNSLDDRIIVDKTRKAAKKMLHARLEHFGGNVGRALELFEAAVSKAPGVGHFLEWYGDALVEAGRWSAARDIYSRAIETGWDSARLRTQRAHMSLHLSSTNGPTGNEIRREGINDAQTDCQRAVDMDAHYSPAHAVCLRANQAPDRSDESLSLCETILPEALTDLTTVRKCARTFERKSRRERAIRLNELAIALGEKDALIHNRIAWMLATCKPPDVDPQVALEHAELALWKLHDHQAAVYDTKAAALATSGRFSEAIDSQMKAIQVAPEGSSHRRMTERLNKYQAGKAHKRCW